MSAEGIRDQAEIPNPNAAVDTPTAPPPELSLRDELKTRMEAVKTAPEGETVEQRDARVRDEQGRFAEKPKEAKPTRPVLTVAKPAAAQPGAGNTPPEVAAPPAAAGAAVKPPDGWTAAAKAKFATLDPDVQAEIVRRETDMHRQFTTQDQDRTLGKGIREVAGPYLATIRAEGGDEKQAFAQFLNYAHIMRSGTEQQKAASIASVVNLYKIPPQALFSILQGSSVQSGQPLQHDPQSQAAIQPQQITALVQAEFDRQRQVQSQTETQTAVEAFAADPANVHYEKVKPVMGKLLLGDLATGLQDAYEQACQLDPEIRSKLIADQLAAKEQERLTAASARTDAARRAAGSITGGPGGVKPNGAIVERSLGEEIRANMQAAQGRV